MNTKIEITHNEKKYELDIDRAIELEILKLVKPAVEYVRTLKSGDCFLPFGVTVPIVLIETPERKFCSMGINGKFLLYGDEPFSQKDYENPTHWLRRWEYVGNIADEIQASMDKVFKV